MENGSAVGANDDHRHVSGTGGKRNVGSASARNSFSYRIDVYRVVGAEIQGRELKNRAINYWFLKQKKTALFLVFQLQKRQDRNRKKVERKLRKVC